MCTIHVRTIVIIMFCSTEGVFPVNMPLVVVGVCMTTSAQLTVRPAECQLTGEQLHGTMFMLVLYKQNVVYNYDGTCPSSCCLDSYLSNFAQTTEW